MVYRIETGLRSGVPDARGRHVVERAAQSLGLSVDACRTRDIYKIAADLTPEQATQVRDGFYDRVVGEAALDRLEMQSSFDWCLEIGFKAGVTDNLGRTARGALRYNRSRARLGRAGLYGYSIFYQGLAHA